MPGLCMRRSIDTILLVAHDLVFFNDKPRSLVLTEGLLTELRLREGDFSLVDETLLAADCERCLESSRISSRLAFSCEYGVSEVSRISTNLEVDIVSSLIESEVQMVCRRIAIDRGERKIYDGLHETLLKRS